MKTIVSLFVLIISFTWSTNVRSQCDYSITMNSYWGDGWNGGQLSITINGITTIHELLNGATQTDILTVNTGDTIVVEYLGGSTDNNSVTFELFDLGGTMIYDSWSDPFVGIHYTTVANCYCYEPSNLYANNLSISSTSLSWTENSTATTWQVEWGTLGFIPGTGTSVTTTNNPYILTGLSPGITYDFYVQSICSPGDSSLLIGPLTFTTLTPPCMVPATNYITNGGFESIDSCQTNTYTGDGNVAGNWLGGGFAPGGVAMPWIQVTYGSPDTWNTCYNYQGLWTANPPHSGDGFAGFLTNTPNSNPNWNEYISQELLQPLQVGQEYCLTFFVRTTASNDPIATNVEVVFTNTQISPPNSSYFSELTGYAPDYIFSFSGTPPITGYGPWEKACYTFISDGTEEWITFGQFGPLAYDPSNTQAYIHIDDISLYDNTPFPVNTQSACNGCDGMAWVDTPGTFSWYNSNDSLLLTGPDTITGLCPGDYYVYNECGCRCEYVPFQITDSLCNLNISIPDIDACQGDSAQLTSVVSGGTAPYSFFWSSLPDTTQGIAILPASTTSYIVTVTDSAGNTATDTSIVTISPYPSVDLGADTTLCNGPLILDALNSGAVYNWQDGSSNQTLSVSSTGIYSVDVSFGTCQTSDTINVSFSGPQVNLGPDTTTCSPNFIINAGNPGSTYLWQDGSVNQTFSISDTGIYYVEVYDQFGCSSIDSIIVSLGSIIVDLGADTLLCNADSILLDAANFGMNYLWQDGSTNQQFLVNGPGVYSVEVTNGLCTDIDSILIEIDNPVASFSVSDLVGCEESIFDFTDLSAGSNLLEWLWNFGDGFTSNDQNPSHIYTNEGFYNVSLSITTNQGCVSDSSKLIQVSVLSNPVAAFSYSPSDPQVGNQVQFQDESQNANNWQWNFGDMTSSTSQNPTHTYSTSGDQTVQLIVSNQFCTDTAYAYFQVSEDLLFYVPNSFTPDGDQFNNTFSPVFSSGYDPYNFHLTIFNRWGEIIFESHDATIGWDGTYRNGELVQDGAYVWKIKFKESSTDKNHQYTGHVNLLR